MTSIKDCPEEGKGGDPNLNKRKNIRSNNGRATLRSVQWMKALADPQNFVKGGSRSELTRLGEGQKITVVAYALVARAEGAETCNCALTAPRDTDNHIVLVDPTLSKPKLTKAIESESETSEFTPRVRLDHSNFTRAKLRPLINRLGRQLVRITGLLMFDSEHFLGHHLIRHNNWEIHPVLKLEYCVAATCTDTSDVGWKSLDSR
ncbi:MAG: hypothetical protein QOH88_3121 [Verrucomicrobiota bacterium]|jgi:hypothetical protein